MIEISKEIKIWYKIDVKLEPAWDGPYSKKEGPFLELGKTDCRELLAEIMEEVNKQIDWKNPDKIILRNPLWRPERQVCKFNGK